MKEKVLMFGSKNIDTINNSETNSMYKNLYLSEKESEEKLLKDIKLANGLKAQLGVKKSEVQHW